MTPTGTRREDPLDDLSLPDMIPSPSPTISPPSTPGPLDLCCPGQVPYRVAWQWQQQRVHQLLQDPTLPDGLLLLTHSPVYTLGQGSSRQYLRFNPETAPHELYTTERGGEVTYHGPGQWVGYPILNLKRHRCDLHWYLRQLEQVLMDVLAALDLPGERIPGLTGVWVEGTKVGAIGIRVRRWISFHGFSLNVCPDLTAYQAIIPCGISDRPVGSLCQFLPNIAMEQVQPLIIQSFCQQFQLSPQPLAWKQWLRPTSDR